MPPRFVYWTILIDGKPTAFRAREQQELLPTVGQLKRANRDVVMKWFARGKLWDSPEAERAADHRPAFSGEKRGADWRPGGAHKDPRDRFKKTARPERAWSDKESPARSDRDKLGPPGAGERKSFAPRPGGDRKPWRDKPPGGPRKPWSARPDGARKPWGAKPVGARKPWGAKPDGPRKPWSAKPDGARKPWSAKPDGPRKPWTPKPTGQDPRGREARGSSPNQQTSDGGWRRDSPTDRKRPDDDSDKK